MQIVFGLRPVGYKYYFKHEARSCVKNHREKLHIPKSGFATKGTRATKAIGRVVTRGTPPLTEDEGQAPRAAIGLLHYRVHIALAHGVVS